MGDLPILMRRADVLAIPGVTRGIWRRVEKTVPRARIPGRKRGVWRREDVLKALGIAK